MYNRGGLLHGFRNNSSCLISAAVTKEVTTQTCSWFLVKNYADILQGLVYDFVMDMQ